MNIQQPHFRGTYSIQATSILDAHDMNRQGVQHLEKIRWEADRHAKTIKNDLPDNFHLEFFSEKVINNGRAFPADAVHIQVLKEPNRWVVEDQYTMNRHMGEDLPGFFQRVMEEAKNLKETYFPS